VQFTRVQDVSTIHADFKAVSPEDRAPNSICISCIYWEGKDECFVTSVDTIYLLESLVGVRFTVEEKNRIRRNLEGFRPLTVSKAKADSEDFFKVIMGFPAPKPRNIEKDVKDFPWKILSHALKKIIGKYVSKSVSLTLGFRVANVGVLCSPVCKLFFNSWGSSEFVQWPPLSHQSGVRCRFRIAACFLSSVGARILHARRVHGQSELNCFLIASCAIEVSAW
jgi:hypothetical protein